MATRSCGVQIRTGLPATMRTTRMSGGPGSLTDNVLPPRRRPGSLGTRGVDLPRGEAALPPGSRRSRIQGRRSGDATLCSASLPSTLRGGRRCAISLPLRAGTLPRRRSAPPTWQETRAR
jgi:hypothetical protein